MPNRKNLPPENEFIDNEGNDTGTHKTEKNDTRMKLGHMLQQARKEKGLTQEQVADLARTNKAYISKIEKDQKDVRFSTLQRIVTEGLGGHIEVTIKF
jgi:DNA-binding XRE family transcriptional regulator